jgi:hypothetical protein
VNKYKVARWMKYVLYGAAVVLAYTLDQIKGLSWIEVVMVWGVFMSGIGAGYLDRVWDEVKPRKSKV